MAGEKVSLLATTAGAVILAGCSAGLGTGPSSRIGYEQASIVSPLGYNSVALAPDRYRILVGGKQSTPTSHLEKIAIVRAAEIGTEQNMRYFKVESVTRSETCTPAKQGVHKSGGHGELRHSLLSVEVHYAKSPPDPSYQEAKPTFERLRPELDTDPIVPETPMQAPGLGCT